MALARVLEHNSSITELSLAVRSRIVERTEEGRCEGAAPNLCAAKRDRRSRSDGFGKVTGAQQFYRYIRTCSMWRRCENQWALILTCVQSNWMGEGGGLALAKALEHNNSITTLDLRVRGGTERET